MMRQVDPQFFAAVFSQRAIDHRDHGGYYNDDHRNLRCVGDDELIVPSPEWFEETEASG